MSNSAILEPIKGAKREFAGDDRDVYKGGGKKKKTPEESILLFTDALEETDNLKMVGYYDDFSHFVIEDIVGNAYALPGQRYEVSIAVLVDSVQEKADAKSLISVLQGERDPIILNGITRIVGYFSRVNNWNRSKIGELRDRQLGTYGNKSKVYSSEH